MQHLVDYSAENLKILVIVHHTAYLNLILPCNLFVIVLAVFVQLAFAAFQLHCSLQLLL